MKLPLLALLDTPPAIRALIRRTATVTPPSTAALIKGLPTPLHNAAGAIGRVVHVDVDVVDHDWCF